MPSATPIAPPVKIPSLFARGQRVYRDLAEIGLRPWQKFTIFDVGANYGTSFCHMPRWCPRAQFYAFEPTPELVKALQQYADRFPNYHVIPKAVGEHPGTLPFNVAGQWDWGCSSLLEFSDNLEQNWPGRGDFVVTEKITVAVIRLDAFIREHKILKIDFLHIDTQGSDLGVLKSLGEEIRRVRAGVLEVPQSREVALYKNQPSREEAEGFLRQHGLEIWKVVSEQNEDNLHFRRK